MVVVSSSLEGRRKEPQAATRGASGMGHHGDDERLLGRGAQDCEVVDDGFIVGDGVASRHGGINFGEGAELVWRGRVLQKKKEQDDTMHCSRSW